jgi:peptide subunit release factor 1 (eRF1)
MIETGVVKDRLNQLMYMEEDNIMEGFHQEVQKERDKSWNDQHIKRRHFKEGDIVLLFESKFFQHPRKFRMHWLEPYEVKNVKAGGSIQLKYLRGT